MTIWNPTTKGIQPHMITNRSVGVGFDDRRHLTTKAHPQKIANAIKLSRAVSPPSTVNIDNTATMKEKQRAVKNASEKVLEAGGSLRGRAAGDGGSPSRKAPSVGSRWFILTS
jgi:hypothetical protein